MREFGIAVSVCGMMAVMSLGGSWQRAEEAKAEAVMFKACMDVGKTFHRNWNGKPECIK